MLKRLKKRLKLELSFARDILSYWNKVRHYNASVDTESDKMKLQYTILRENHVIEKGLSMKNTKDWFGLDKIIALENKLEQYIKIHGADEFLLYPICTIASYLDYFNNAKNIPAKANHIKEQLAKLQQMIPCEKRIMEAGIKIVDKCEIQRLGKGNFEELVTSRHSLRFYESKPVKKEDIEKVLKIAQRTPSACNRQGWHTHIYEGSVCENLLKWQGGCRGFEEYIHTAILVTADIKAFLSYEVFQPYVDGGLYAMNLINAIHFVGLGGIPLSCGFTMDKLKQLGDFGVPKNEVPIVIVGIGYLPSKVKIAVSSRKSIDKTNCYH